ncbi:MAG: hypothetical protein PHF35_02245 [Candidatus Moranbacteria bacterium]|nr:hypothetical protein [Candidatus Moranbacteria bacterium]
MTKKIQFSPVVVTQSNVETKAGQNNKPEAINTANPVATQANQSQNKSFYSFSAGKDFCSEEGGNMPDNGQGKVQILIQRDNKSAGSFTLNGMCVPGGYKILSRTDQYLYFAIRPDGLGGFYVHDYVYPNILRMKLSDNSVEQLADMKELTTVGVSNDGNLAVYWANEGEKNANWKIVTLNTESLSKKEYVMPTKNADDSYGDYIFSPSNDMLAIGVIDRNKAAENEKYLKNTFYILDLANGTYTKYDSTNKSKYPWVNPDYVQPAEQDMNADN